ncbi:ABC transporter permease [Dehalococcoidia bacterium]|nr:ABC transporter permease [Dehalococcoidia bacterium]MCL0103421.1 ABC transporter permease [Dehalococcoidia bacterium]
MMVLRQFIKLTSTELKLFRREPIALFFTFIFPVFFLFLTMEVFIPGDVPREEVINRVSPALMVLIIASTAIFAVPLTIISYRNIKFLKRLKGSPVTPLTILGSLALSNFIVTVLGIALLAVVAVLVYDATLGGSLISFLAGFVLTFLSLGAIFLFIPAVARSPRTAIAISYIIFFPVMFFSGVFIPLGMLPDWIERYISPFIPITHAVELMQGLWQGDPLLDLTREVLILLGILCLGLVIAARTFRWE